ncbi:tetratricopeptide repeat protein [Chitinimonas sp. BJYL2]|uniref:O-linked N-acetylglucosamine transferase, SPINDLY family protein n=1 Tax=Chitinimonas sp. BJYL2 TaxID=2976696 RepID=UPI0022B302B6|nr:hypothetical protein [Chitinimonas sp. BJYL2]
MDQDLLRQLGAAQVECGQIHAGAETLQQLLAAGCRLPEVYINLGIAWLRSGKAKEAKQAFMDALLLEPDSIRARTGLGQVYLYDDCPTEARLEFAAVLAVSPDDKRAMAGFADAHRALKLHPEAVYCYSELVRLAPDDAYAASMLVHAAMEMYDWEDLDARIAHAHRLIVDEGKHGGMVFALCGLREFSRHDLYQATLQRSQAAREAPLESEMLLPPGGEGERLRIGYLSSDFGTHPVSHLLVGALECHDRSKFEVFGYATGPKRDGADRQRIEAAFEHFHDVRALADDELQALIRTHRLHILVELNGHTAYSRIDGLSYKRCAPIQVTWLGYPGTTGTAFADYLFGDAVVTPPEHAGQYSEKVVNLPHCYQPNDNKRANGLTSSREAEGLASDAFVMCSFNQPFKLGPATFDIWCALLKKIDGSQLWLLEPPEAAKDNLLEEAHQRGVDASRIVFAPKRTLAEHMGRIGLADLALDTFPYGSHTTGSDALWAGVPLVTMMGETFASRVAASLLVNVGLSELITHTPEEYEHCILRLAQHPDELSALRVRLQAQLLQTPLFDTRQFTRDLEAVYTQLWRHQVSKQNKGDES